MLEPSHHTQRGKFPDMKGCVCELLAATGELATAAGAFDVIAFCNSAWAWSATYSQRLSLLASAQVGLGIKSRVKCEHCMFGAHVLVLLGPGG